MTTSQVNGEKTFWEGGLRATLAESAHGKWIAVSDKKYVLGETRDYVETLLPEGGKDYYITQVGMEGSGTSINGRGITSNNNSQVPNGSILASGNASESLTSGDYIISYVNPEHNFVNIYSEDHPLPVLTPTKSFQTFNKRPIFSLDVSPQGELGVFGSEDGVLKVFDVMNCAIRRDLEGHKGDVMVSKFFPSGQVVLSGAADWRLRIWSVISGECAATLTGHTGGILGAAIIDRGRNILSCSRDGTAKLWDIPTQTAISTYGTSSKAINDIAVAESPVVNRLTPAQDLREVSTEGRLILLAGEDQTLTAYDVRARKKLFEASTKSPVNTCLIMSDAITCVGGTDDGRLLAWDLRNPKNPLSALKITNSPILHLTSIENTKIWVGTADGMVIRVCANLEDGITDKALSSRISVDLSLLGSDYDPIRGIKVTRKSEGYIICTAARDGFVRRYDLSENI